MTQLVLYQFPISHYCEKIRWVLDRKRLAYEVKNQLPGPHMLENRRLVGRTSVPLLIDGHHAVGDSSEIALYLDDQFPDERLIPHEEGARARVLALEEFFDELAGPSVRRFLYSFVATDARLFKRMFFGGYRGFGSLYGKVTSGVLSGFIADTYKAGPHAVVESRAQVEQSIARLEELIGGDEDRYLVGDTLTLADVTAASLLAPALAVPGSPWELEISVPEVIELRDRLRSRPGGRWVLARYARDRGHSSAS